MKKEYYILLVILSIAVSFSIVIFSLTEVPAGDIKINQLMEKGKNKYYEGKLEESREIYSLVLKKDKNNISALKNLIIINGELGNKKSVLADYKKLLKKEPDNINLVYRYGINLYKYGQKKKAQKVLSEAYSNKEIINLTDCERSLMYFYLGEIYTDESNYQKALNIYEKGIDIFPSNVLNYLGIANLFYRQDIYDKSLKYYKQALSKDSSLAQLYPKIASCYQKTNNFKLAYHYWQKSVSSRINKDYARSQLKNIEKKHPELLEDNKAKRKFSTDIKWNTFYEINNNTEDIPELRIGLLDNISQVIFKSKKDFNVICLNNNKNLFKGSGGDVWKIVMDNGYYLFYKNDVMVKSISNKNIIIDTDHFAIFNVSYGQGYFWSGSENRQYRGKFELYSQSSKDFTLINTVNIEEYLFSVVPSEIPSWWPEEAIKAQSIAARTYALKNKELNRHKLYDLCDGVHCAVYKGVKIENKRTRNAVLETSGEVITTSDGGLINAVFSSNSGGYSESSKDVWGSKVSYLEGSSNTNLENKRFPLTPFVLYDWIINRSSDTYYYKYSSGNTYRWIKKISAEYFIDRYNLSKLENIISKQRSKGGSINSIIIKGQQKEIVINKDSIRSGMGGLKSNRFFIDKIYNNNGYIEEVVIYGSGWGHSVGLDQTASAGMAQHGSSYKEILAHFYKNTEIMKMY